MDSALLTAAPREQGLEMEMLDRNNIVNHIIGVMGNGGDREIAEQVFDELRADDRIFFDGENGLSVRGGVDLIEVVAKLIH